MTMQIITPQEYVWPDDGHDICESCNYLTVVHTTTTTDDGDRVVPLCVDCATPATPCPRHEGAYDCTPFCDVCEGEQEYKKESN